MPSSDSIKIPSAIRPTEAEIESDEQRAAGEWSPAQRGTAGASGRLRSFLAREKAWVGLTLALVSVWATELYLVQAFTLIPPQEIGARLAFWAPKIRLAMDLLFLSTMVLLFGRSVLTGLAVGAFVVDLGLLTYYRYFFRPLSALVLYSNFGEGLKVSGGTLDLFPRLGGALLLTSLAGKLTLLFLRGPCPLLRRERWGLCGVLAASYCALFVVGQYFDPLWKVQSTRGVARLGLVRGYLGPWCAELYYFRGDEVLKSALERAETIKSDQLTPVEADIPIRKHLLIIQAESLDYAILGYRANGREVTPFLNRLRDKSMFYRVRATHIIGSADADFMMLTAKTPSNLIITYKIPDYPYRDTLPEFLRPYGYKTYFYHGNVGHFYNRRTAFEKMGFDGTFFREEMELQNVPADSFGVKDADALAFLRGRMRREKGPACDFIVTLTSHTPYRFLSADEQKIYPDPTSIVQRYMNSISYLDRCLGDFLESLGSTPATVVIYGDHPTEVSGEGFEPDRSAGREYVPCFIYDNCDNTEDLSQVQKTRGQPIALNGNLYLLDVVNYLRSQFSRTKNQIPDHERDGD